jgi:flavin reductase (DIM6/NTAB) family NADH-FMN oxidoreductase RutF
MGEDRKEAIGKALGRIPGSLFIMTSHFEERMRGVMVSWVQQAGFKPPMVMIALSKGRPIVPLIHDSHGFALCQIAPDDKLLMRRFGSGKDAGDNPFEAIDIMKSVSGSPIIKRSLAYLDCELVRHIDVDGDHDIYVGIVRDGNLLGDKADPIVHLRKSGMHY